MLTPTRPYQIDFDMLIYIYIYIYTLEVQRLFFRREFIIFVFQGIQNSILYVYLTFLARGPHANTPFPYGVIPEPVCTGNHNDAFDLTAVEQLIRKHFKLNGLQLRDQGLALAAWFIEGMAATKVGRP